jgi:serine protease
VYDVSFCTVAGAAALVWSFYPECSNNQIRNVLALTAKDVNPSSNGCNAKTGFGLIQAKAAYDMLASFGCEAGSFSRRILFDCCV